MLQWYRAPINVRHCSQCSHSFLLALTMVHCPNPEICHVGVVAAWEQRRATSPCRPSKSLGHQHTRLRPQVLPFFQEQSKKYGLCQKSSGRGPVPPCVVSRPLKSQRSISILQGPENSSNHCSCTQKRINDLVFGHHSIFQRVSKTNL